MREVRARGKDEACRRRWHEPPSQRPASSPEDPREFLLRWLDGLESAPADGRDVGEPTFFEFEATYPREGKRPNLLLVHYDDLQRNLAAEIRRVSHFLEIETQEALLGKLVEAASFASMKEHGNALFPKLRMAFDRGAERFINRGRSGAWRAYMTPDDMARYDAIAGNLASPGLAAWLEGGRAGAGDPRLAPD